MKCPTPCPFCDEITELHHMQRCMRCQTLYCEECADDFHDGLCRPCILGIGEDNEE